MAPSLEVRLLLLDVGKNLLVESRPDVYQGGEVKLRLRKTMFE